ncbi:MAG TPA: hypothetical protein VFX37_06975 [Pseudolabrys sp.]|nr:hypothetical protein [Pseudolabrys sp.]
MKLGGSFVSSPYLHNWLDVLAGCGGHAVVVPGGGPFADAVRNAQAEVGFDDQTAHHLALMAMEQFGRVLVGVRSVFAMADTKASIARLLLAGAVPVWSPLEMVLKADDLPTNWDVTSDSLAAWLVGQIGASRLLLIKHGQWSEDRVGVAALLSDGSVDKAFPQFLAASGAEASIVGPKPDVDAAARLCAGKPIGTGIDLHGPDARRLLSPCQR